MTTTTSHAARPTAGTRMQLVADLHPRVWVYSVIAYAALMVFCMVAASIDERLLYGVSVWTKPFKFSLSLVAYFGTMVLIARLLPAGYFATWQGRTLAAIPAFCAVLEMVYITMQAGLGEPSHFNTGTPFHAAMYSLMGFGAALMVAVLVWLGVAVARHNRLTDPLILAVVAGLFLTFLLGGGFGAYLGSQTSHWVGGAASDADGLLLFKWARDGGDLRVAHFFGMHAMQALPLFALALPRSWPPSWRLALVVGAATAYAAFTWATFSQALAGQSFLAGI